MTACRVDANVDVTVAEDGSGTVVVTVDADDDAVDLVPELLSGLQLDDISEAGWAVSSLSDRAGGGIRVTASKEFATAGQLQFVLDEIAGPGVIFSDVVLTQNQSFGETRWDFSASVNPSPPLEAFSDPDLAAVLDGLHFGRPLGEILANVGAPSDLFGLEFSVTLPADIEAPDDAPDESADAPGESADVSGDALGESADESVGAPDGSADVSGDASGESDGESGDALGESADESVGASGESADVSGDASGESDGESGDALGESADASVDDFGDIAGPTGNWSFSYGDAPVTISLSALSLTSTPGVWRNIARVAAVALAVLLVAALAVTLVSVMRAPKGRGRWATRRRRKRAAMREAEARKPRRRLLRLLVVDAHGVIVRPIDPLEGLLLPTILAEFPDADPAVVRERYSKLVLGRLTPDEFWSDVGLGLISVGMETRYLSSYRLVPGLHDFLDRLAVRNLPVAVVVNQPRRWGERLRRMAQLEDSTSMWVTSGEVGATLPNPSLLEAARRKMSVDARDCLYLSSVPEYLDTAKKLGMATAYFAVSPSDVQETSHALVRGYKDILRGSGRQSSGAAAKARR